MKYAKLLVAMLAIVAIAWLGVGFAYQSSYESDNNGLEGRFVTINQGGTGSAVLDYVQYYDTIIADEEVFYYVPMDAGEDLIKLNDSAYAITISETGSDGTYNFGVDCELPSLFTGSTPQARDWCQFVFKLTKGEDVYYGFTTLSDLTAGREFQFYAAEEDEDDSTAHSEQVAGIVAGSYSLDLFLKMPKRATTIGYITGIAVDKTNFVDEFHLENFTIRFTVVSCP